MLKCTDCSLPVPSRDQCSRSAAHLLRHAGATTLGVRPPATASATCSTIGTTPARVTINRVTTMDRATLGTIAGPFALAARVMDGAAGEPFVCVLASPPHKRSWRGFDTVEAHLLKRSRCHGHPTSSPFGIVVARTGRIDGWQRSRALYQTYLSQKTPDAILHFGTRLLRSQPVIAQTAALASSTHFAISWGRARKGRGRRVRAVLTAILSGCHYAWATLLFWRHHADELLAMGLQLAQVLRGFHIAPV